MKAVIYCRVSTKDQVQNLSLSTQQQQCEAYCKRSGWEVAQVFVEEGESAKTADRTELTRLLAYCRANRGSVHYVVVYAVNRLARNTHDHHVLRAVLGGVGVKLRSVTEPIEETSAGKFVETLLAAVAQFDNDVRSERTAAGMKATLARGRWPFVAPLGYRNVPGATLEHDPEKAPLVRKAFELAAGGSTKAEILEALNAHGLKARGGKPLKPETLGHLLANPIYAGRIEVARWGVSQPAAFTPIVDGELWSAAQAALQRRKHLAPIHARAHPDFPLRHYVRCGRCNRPLTGSWSKGRTKRYPYYHCPGRACAATVRVRREILEEAFIARLDELRPTPEFLRAFREFVLDVWQELGAESRREAEALHRRAEALRQRKTALVEAFVYRRVIDQSTYEEHLAKVNEELGLVELSRHDAEMEQWDIDGVLAYAEHVAINAGRLWREADQQQRLRLQGYLFSEGLTYEPGGGVRTTASGLFFNDLAAETATESNVATLIGASWNPQRVVSWVRRTLELRGQAA